MQKERTACWEEQDCEVDSVAPKLQTKKLSHQKRLELLNPENVEIDMSIDSNSQRDSMIDKSGFQDIEKSEKESYATSK